MVCLSRGLLRSNALETSLTSVDTAAKVRNPVNTKRTGFSVAGPQSSRILSLPISERMNAFRVSVAFLCTLALWLLDAHQNTVKQAWFLVRPFVVSYGFLQTQARRISCGSLASPSQNGTCSRRTVWSGSPATLSVAETPLRWSRGDTKARLLGPQNAHDLRSGMVAPRAGSTRQIERQMEEVFTVSVSMSGGGKHTSEILLWPSVPGTARRGHQCWLASECSRSKRVEKQRMEVLSCAMTLGWNDFPLLSLTCSSSNFGRVHSLFRGMGANYRRPGPVVYTGLVSSAHACLLLLLPWNGSVVTWGNPEDFDGCPFFNWCSLKTAPSSRGEIPKILMGVPSSIAAV